MKNREINPHALAKVQTQIIQYLREQRKFGNLRGDYQIIVLTTDEGERFGWSLINHSSFTTLDNLGDRISAIEGRFLSKIQTRIIQVIPTCMLGPVDLELAEADSD